jgi:hypothetical protein
MARTTGALLHHIIAFIPLFFGNAHHVGECDGSIPPILSALQARGVLFHELGRSFLSLMPPLTTTDSPPPITPVISRGIGIQRPIVIVKSAGPVAWIQAVQPKPNTTILDPSFGQDPHSKYLAHFCLASSRILRIGSNASIYDIPSVFEVENDALKVFSKRLSVTLAELCRFGDDSEHQ